jgi:hypothetical protein
VLRRALHKNWYAVSVGVGFSRHAERSSGLEKATPTVAAPAKADAYGLSKPPQSELARIRLLTPGNHGFR